MSRNTSIGCECGLNNLCQNSHSANQVFKPRAQPINPTVSHHLTSMEHYECVNTELGLASVGSLKTYSKGSEQIKEEEFMARPRKKKLGLTKEQLAFLEDVYLAHNIVTTNQKLELAEKLNVRSQQVEVWFHNRRARTKIKQTKMDCQYLRELCSSLSDENRRLKWEMLELTGLIKPEPTPQGN